MRRWLPEIVLAFHEDVEGAELHLLVMLSGMQRIEIGDAIYARITASPSSEARLPDLPRRLNDPRMLQTHLSAKQLAQCCCRLGTPNIVDFHGDGESTGLQRLDFPTSRMLTFKLNQSLVQVVQLRLQPA